MRRPVLLIQRRAVSIFRVEAQRAGKAHGKILPGLPPPVATAQNGPEAPAAAFASRPRTIGGHTRFELVAGRWFGENVRREQQRKTAQRGNTPLATGSLTDLNSRAGRRVLTATLGAHILHDGYTDVLYVLLPVWQAELALSLGEVGFLKTAYSAVMAGLQVPAGFLAERLGERALLAAGTAVAGIAFVLAGWSGGFFGLVVCLALGGVGSSVQHPLGSSITARAYEGPRLRTALSTYNFSGDVGKMLFPAATAWLVAGWDWRAATTVIGIAGLAVAILVLILLRTDSGRRQSVGPSAPQRHPDKALPADLARRGFFALSAIGVIDSATRMGFLILLPFLLISKGASLPTIGTCLTLVFAGGAAGKFVCGIIAVRLGIIRTVVVTECATALGIIGLLPLPIGAAMVLLPFVGIALNGTSSVLYGTVAELVPRERRARAFGIFYTYTIGAGAISPSVYGLLSDWVGVSAALVVVGLVVLAVLPLSFVLRPALDGTRTCSV
jgi:MFS transporter, FSR family, fosmidomycin resistance protein